MYMYVLFFNILFFVTFDETEVIRYVYLNFASEC